MKSIGFIEKLKGLSSKELILLGIILSIFLPFYLFVVVLCLYIISLIFTGDMKSILQKMGEHPMLLLFLAIVLLYPFLHKIGWVLWLQ